MRYTVAFVVALLILPAILWADVSSVDVSAGKADADGIIIHEVRSTYQSGTTTIRVLLPDHLEKTKQYPVVYVLPVEAADGNRFGNGMLEVKKNDLANRYQAIFVEPLFFDLPWYADHPTNPKIRQESYLLKVVVPFIEKTYPARHDAAGRRLVGFSKSGWGAFSLLLRHPDLFSRAAAWDAPMMLDAPGKYGSGPIFGTKENFENYRITTLLKKHPPEFQSGKRLILLGYGNFRQEHQRIEELMQSLKIDHKYRDGPQRKHEWGSGWLPEAVQMLFDDVEPQPKT